MSAPCMQKKFVFLLQRFALVVQEREYIRVRGFHLVCSAYADLTYGNDAPRFYGLPRWTVILYVNVNAFVTKSYSCSHRVFPVCLWCRALQLFVSFASLHLSPTLAGGVRLFRCISLLVSLHLAPFLAGGIRLFGRISSFVSLHLFPTLSSGVWLSGCLQFKCLPI